MIRQVYQVTMTRKAHEPGPVAPYGSPAPGTKEDNLIRSVLDVVPLPRVLDILADYVRRANRADHMRAALVLRGERAKPRIEDRSGPSWSTEEVAQRLGKTSETVRSYIAAGALIAYPSESGRTRWRLPTWQFDSEAARVRAHEWVTPLVAAYGQNGWGLVDFLTVPRDQLDGASYLRLLLGGQARNVVAIAKRANPD
jgi:hypothetical protein